MADAGSYDLVMPFVTCKSNGGPHDDTAYVAGFEMGALDANLGNARAMGVLATHTMIHAANREQADLIAMKHGYSAKFTDIEESPDWLHLTLVYAA